MLRNFLYEERGIYLDICNDLLEGKSTDSESIARINERIIAVNEAQRNCLIYSYALTILLCFVSTRCKLNVFPRMVIAGCLASGLTINIRYLSIANNYKRSYQRLREIIND